MSSIKINSDFSRIFELIEKSLNSNIEVVKRYAENPTFDAGANQSSQKVYNTVEQSNGSSKETEYENPYDTDQYIEDGYGYTHSTNYYNSPDLSEEDLQIIDEYYDGLRSDEVDPMKQEIGSNYEDVFGSSKEIIGRDKQRRQPRRDKSESNQSYSKRVSRGRLREAVVWSEILGPPACKSRHDKDITRRYTKSR